MKEQIKETEKTIERKIEAARGQDRGVTQGEIIEIAFNDGVRFAINEIYKLSNAPLVSDNQKQTLREITDYLNKQIKD